MHSAFNLFVFPNSMFTPLLLFFFFNERAMSSPEKEHLKITIIIIIIINNQTISGTGNRSFFLSLRLIPKKLMTSYTGMEECKKTNTTAKRKIIKKFYIKRYCSQ